MLLLLCPVLFLYIRTEMSYDVDILRFRTLSREKGSGKGNKNWFVTLLHKLHNYISVVRALLFPLQKSCNCIYSLPGGEAKRSRVKELPPFTHSRLTAPMQARSHSIAHTHMYVNTYTKFLARDVSHCIPAIYVQYIYRIFPQCIASRPSRVAGHQLSNKLQQREVSDKCSYRPASSLTVYGVN